MSTNDHSLIGNFSQ